MAQPDARTRRSPGYRQATVGTRRRARFDRVTAFNDAVFAIALTLLVLDLDLPALADKESASEFVDALGEIVPDLISFAIAFSIVGQYWIAQHRFYNTLHAVDSRFLGLNVVYWRSSRSCRSRRR